MVVSTDTCRATEEREERACCNPGFFTLCSDTVTFLSLYSVVLLFSHLEGEPLISGEALTPLSHLHV